MEKQASVFGQDMPTQEKEVSTKELEEEIETLLQVLEKIVYKNQLQLFAKSLKKVNPKAFSILSQEKREAFIALLRKKVLDILLKKGDIPDRDFLWAFPLFYPPFKLHTDEQKDKKALESRIEKLGFEESYNISQDSSFDSFIALCQTELAKSDYSDYERLYFIETLSVCKLLSGNPKDCLREFLGGVCQLNYIGAYAKDLYSFILDFINAFSIPIEFVVGLQRELLNPAHFFTLNRVQQRSIFLWYVHCFWNVRIYFNNLIWRQNYPIWQEILKQILQRGDLDLAMHVSFYIYHKFGNSAHTLQDWELFNNDIVKTMEPYYIEYAKNLPPCKSEIRKEGKILIGILKDRVVENSPYKVEWSLCKTLMQDKDFRDKYEIYIYDMEYIQKSISDEGALRSFQNLGIQVRQPAHNQLVEETFYYSHLKRAIAMRDCILKDGVDVLITTASGMDCSDFIIATRSAPRQIFWSHGNFMYDIFGIDERISHCAKPGKFIFKGFSAPMDRERFYNPPRDPSIIQKEKEKFPIKEDTIVLGTIGRLVKVDSDEYLECIAKVLKKYPQAIFIAAGMGNMAGIRKKVEDLGVSDQFFMPGWVDPHVYGHIIDIFCNTFPLQQGESIAEYASKGRGAYITKIAMSQEELKNIILSQDAKEWHESCAEAGTTLKDHVAETLEISLGFQPNTNEGFVERLGYYIEHIRDEKLLRTIKNMVDIHAIVGRRVAINGISQLLNDLTQGR